MTAPQQEVKTPVKVSEKPTLVPIPHNVTQPPPPSQPTKSTNKTILDYILYRSIQSRLKQAQIESMELVPSLQTHEKDTIHERKNRWMELLTVAEQDKKAVESVVKGILSNHRSKRPSFLTDNHFEQRLHLCQLTNLIFGRLDTGENDTTNDSSASNKRCRRHHHHHHHVHHQHLHQHHKHHEPSTKSSSEQGSSGTATTATIKGDGADNTKVCRWTHMITPNHCRRHRFQHCDICDQIISTTKANTNATLFQPGLLEAIPTFLKTSADLLRYTLETNSHDNDNNNNNDKKKPMIFAGQKVMGGGMPPRWYDLFLELLTQAAIECYLCDMQTGLESIYEIFSYGDVEDEDEPEHHTDEEDDEDDDDDADDIDSDDINHHAVTTSLSTDEKTDQTDDSDNDDDDWSVEAADHHLLFPKTRTMYLFKTQVREREKEILVIEENVSLHQHFQALAKRYPLDNFEKNMGEYIQMIHHTMAIPELHRKDDNNHEGNAMDSIEKVTTTGIENGTSSSKMTPSIYKYPCDGSLLMPELPEEENDDDGVTGLEEHEELSANNKRRASVNLEKDNDPKRHH